MRLVLALVMLGMGCSHEGHVFAGRLSIEGDEARRVAPVGAVRHIYPHDCLSVEPLDLFGVDLFTTRGNLRFVHDPDNGPVMSFYPEDEVFTPWDVTPAVCDVFRGELKRKGIEFEENSAMRGSLELDCIPNEDGLRVYGVVTFDGCTDERKY